MRKRGYAIDNEELEDGLRCVAAPVRECSGAVVGALGIGSPGRQAGCLPVETHYINSRTASIEAAIEQSHSRSTITSIK